MGVVMRGGEGAEGEAELVRPEGRCLPKPLFLSLRKPREAARDDPPTD